VPTADPAPARAGRVALAGLPNAGKSSLLNRLVGEHLAIVSPRPQATRLPVVGVRTDPDAQYVFVDLPGLLEPRYALQRAMRRAAAEALEGADVILHLHPAPDAPAPPFAELAGLLRPPRVPVLLAYTQGDRLEPAARAALQRRHLVTSAVDGEGIDALLAAIRPLLPVQPPLHDPEDVGTQPLRFFVTEYLREAAFDLLGDEVPYAVAAEVEEFREERRPMYIRVTLLVERESHKAIVIGAQGRTIRALGTRARERLEALVGAPVYLDLWVKVLANWRRRPDALARLGFPPPDPENA